MKNSLRIASIFAFAAVLHSASAADLTGTVTLKGTPPPEKDLPLDAKCGALHKGVVKTRFYVVNDKGQLADAVVVLKGVPGAKSTGASAKPVILDQKGCEYDPYVMAVQTGQKIEVKNSDPFMHNVHAMPATPGNPESNKAQMPGSPDLSFTFDHPEEFLKFKCDVHPWMFAYVSVFDHPYFAVTDEKGSFKIENVPPGKYTLEVYHRKAAPIGSPVTQQVEVTDKGGTANVELSVK
jgi:plastocyanin